MTTAERLKKFYDIFRGPRMTIAIISCLLAVFFAGLVIPQKRFIPSKADYDRWRRSSPISSGIIEYLGLNDIYTSPVTIGLFGFFFVNLLVVVGHRVPIVLRRSYLVDSSAVFAGMKAIKGNPAAKKIAFECAGPNGSREALEKSASFFRRKFWWVLISEDSSSFIAVRNRFSPFGFLLFHVSFILCLAGGLLVMYTRFSGKLLLTEGEEFRADMKQFRTITHTPEIFRALPELGMTLKKVVPDYEGGTGTDLSVLINVRYASENFDAVAKVNEPVNKGPFSIMPFDIGVSPLFVLRNRAGREMAGGFFSLNVLKGGRDSFEFENMPFKIYVEFYPDFVIKDGQPSTGTFALNNPVFRLRIEQEKKVLYEGFLKKGETAPFGEFGIECPEIRYWVDFLLIREYGIIPLYLGFALGAVGLIMRLIFYQKSVRVNIENEHGICTLCFTGRSEYYVHTFQEEMELMLEDLGRELDKSGVNPAGGRGL